MVELLLVVVTVGFLVFLIGSLPNSIRLVGKSSNLSTAREIALKQIEEKRELKYPNLSYGDQQITDSRLSLLTFGSGVVSISDCDPAICTQGELVKAVTVTITWQENGRDEKVTLKTMVSENGLN